MKPDRVPPPAASTSYTAILWKHLTQCSRRLISALQYYGVDDPALSWIKDFLTDRRQRVIVNGQSSRWHTVTSGIPQGSVLGPVLFVVYINTMVENDTVSDIYLYADDTKVFKEVTASPYNKT